MHVIRGRTESLGTNRAILDDMFTRAVREDEEVVWVWRAHPQVSFGRRDTNEPGFGRASPIAREQGFEPVEREVGGRAVAYTGSTVAFAQCRPVDDPRNGLDERYEHASNDAVTALENLGVSAERGEPPDSFCPGAHSLQADGKLVGIAQRIRQEAALVSGVVVVRDHEEIAGVLDPVYEALGIDFNPESVGSVAKTGGPSDPTVVINAFEDALVNGRSHTTQQL
jgi:lipoate-protein ligase A